MSIASPDVPTFSRIFLIQNIIKTFLYMAYSTVLLFPILSTPLVADDFAAPFYQFDATGFGITPAVKYGWESAYGGVSFRILGNPLGSLIHFLFVDLAGRFGIPISTTYFILKLGVYLGVGIVAAWVCNQLLLLAGKSLSKWAVLFVTSTVTFVSLQNHALWSNDPVASYPLAGFGSVIFGLAILGYSLRTASLGITSKRIAILSTLTTASVLYYEINVGMIVGIAPLLVVLALRRSTVIRWHHYPIRYPISPYFSQWNDFNIARICMDAEQRNNGRLNRVYRSSLAHSCFARFSSHIVSIL